MAKAESSREERRTARRYRVPGSARVFWDGVGKPVTLTDVSASGCLLFGAGLPPVGTRVFLSLDIGGIPNVRLPALAVRREANASMVAVRFELPTSSTGGLDKLLAQHVLSDESGTRSSESTLAVLVIDRDERSRMRIEGAARLTGARVVATDCAERAVRSARETPPDVVLARADIEGLSALSQLSRELPTALRVAFGRKSAIDSAISMGIAQAVADDPCSAKCLGELLRRGPARTSS
jgi:CheY-like chemotaxis protein